MPAAPIPKNERARLAALQRYDILDSGSETEYDDLTTIAAQICRTPIALITLIDSERQWFKSCVGLALSETPRDQAFCAYAIHESATLVVPDAIRDERFADNALVLGEPRIRFYAGAPLQTADGISLGTLCVIDREPGALSPEQQNALEALARQVVRLIESRYRNRIFAALVEKNTAAMSVKDGAGRLVFVNAAWKEHFGRADHEPLGKTAAEWFAGVRGAKLFEEDVEALRTGTALESINEIPTNSGERTWLTIRFPVGGMAGETMIGAVSVDLTRTILAERRWLESEEKFGKLCVAAPDAIISGDESARVVFWNPAAEWMFGYSAEEIVGRPWAMLVMEEDRARFADPERWKRRTTRQFTGLRRDGSEFPVEVSLARWRADDRDFRTCFVRDLTERQKIESQLEQSRRVESLGQVAATVAHEFNNVLMAISPFNTLITKVAGGDERVQRATAAIEQAVAHAKVIVGQILRYSRAHDPIRKPRDLGSWLKHREEELRLIAGEAVSVTVHVPGEPVVVSCDIQQLEQVVTNVVSNARDAIEGGGSITITLEIRDYCADAMLQDGERCARLSVSDTGAGIDRGDSAARVRAAVYNEEQWDGHRPRACADVG
jgi:PAS domain S-box-containing protein